MITLHTSSNNGATDKLISGEAPSETTFGYFYPTKEGVDEE